jgi:putative aminophosphonate oxidoreductase
MRSFWLQQALADDDTAITPLTGDLRVDICIVGGGYTGLWTALRLKEHEPSLDIAIIEADICGGGASGRNGGFCMTWMSKAATMLKICGAQDGVRLLRESDKAVSAIGQFCADHGIDSHFRHDGWLWTAGNAVQVGAWSETLEQLDKLGIDAYDELDADEVARRTGSEAHFGAVFERNNATLQPALLARGLRRVVAEQGVAIYEQTKMTRLVRKTAPQVKTNRGTVSATRVVLALNAWAHELPEFRRTIIPIGPSAFATEPAPKRLAEIGLTDGVAISDSHMLVNYYRTTRDGRLVWGKGGGPIPFAGRVGTRYDGPAPRPDIAWSELVRYYPSLSDLKIATTWSGPATRTDTGLPSFGRLPRAPAILYGHGYTGNGVGPSYLGGRILASLALDLDDEWANSPLVRMPHAFMPPEPVRFFGGQIVRAAAHAKDRAEDAGRKPSRLVNKLAALAPAGLAPMQDG